MQKIKQIKNKKDQKHIKYIETLTNNIIPTALCEIIISYLNKYHLKIKYDRSYQKYDGSYKNYDKNDSGDNMSDYVNDYYGIEDSVRDNSYYSWKGTYTQGTYYFNVPLLEFCFTMSHHGKIIKFMHRKYTVHYYLNDIMSYIDSDFDNVLSTLGNSSQINYKNKGKCTIYKSSINNFIQELCSTSDYNIKDMKLNLGLRYYNPSLINVNLEKEYNLKGINGAYYNNKINCCRSYLAKVLWEQIDADKYPKARLFINSYNDGYDTYPYRSYNCSSNCDYLFFSNIDLILQELKSVQKYANRRLNTVD